MSRRQHLRQKLPIELNLIYCREYGKKEWALHVDPEPQFGLVARNCFDFNNGYITLF